MKNKLSILAVAVLGVIIAFSMAACSMDDDGGGYGGTYWLRTKQTAYTFSGGTGSPTETYYEWIKYSYENETNYREEYCMYTDPYYTKPAHIELGYEFTAGYYRYTRDKQTSSLTSPGTSTSNTYDLESGLVLKTYTSGSGYNTYKTEISYSVMLLSDTDGVKTYRQYMISYIRIHHNDDTGMDDEWISQDISTQGYSEYRIQKGRILERKDFTHEGMLISVTTYTLADNAAIRKKLRDYTLYNTQSSTYNSYNTVEVISDTDSALILRESTFVNNTLSSQTESVYEKVKWGSSSGLFYTETNTVTITGIDFDDYKYWDKYSIIDEMGEDGPQNQIMIPFQNGAISHGIISNVTIPAQINKKPVTRIRFYARLGYAKSLNIPSSVTSIGFSGCYGYTLISVTFQGTIPESGLHEYAFGSDLREKYLAGGPGTYTAQEIGRDHNNDPIYTWTKQ